MLAIFVYCLLRKRVGVFGVQTGGVRGHELGPVLPPRPLPVRLLVHHRLLHPERALRGDVVLRQQAVLRGRLAAGQQQKEQQSS